MVISGRNIARAHRGFTMMELLAVVAILAIVAAIAFPAGASLARSLDMTRRDDTAKQIYLSAQTRLTALQSSGQLDNLFTNIKETKGPNSISKPSDYPEDDYAGRALYQVAKSDNATTQYLVTSNGDLMTSTMSGSYIIELSPSTGEVYGVFYWDDASDGSAVTHSYDEIIGLVGDRTRSAREKAGIGYYGGGPVSAAINRGGKISIDDTDIKTVNSEELYIKLTNKSFGKIVQEGKTDKLTINVTVSGPKLGVGSWSTATRTLSFSGADLGMTSQSDEVDIILDSMIDGKSFYDIIDKDRASGEQIQPGADITYDVTITYDAVDYKLGGSTVNSLYGSLGASTANPGSNQITVYALRHLNNIRTTKLHGIIWGSNSFRDIVFQNNTSETSDDFIDFNAASWANTSVSIPSRVGGVSTGAAQNPLASTTTKLISLDNLAVDGTALSSGSVVTGNGFLLKNFEVTQGISGATGLFGSVGPTITSLYMTDPIVKGGNNTGALVGNLTNGSVSNCGVYLTSGADRANRTVSGGENSGGLVGTVNGGSSGISSSFAAIDVNGTTTVGGLVGLTSNAIRQSYSSGTVKATDSGAGGLAGNVAQGVDVANCYTTSNVYCNSQAGAFAGTLGSLNDNNYAYGYTVKADGTVDSTFANTTYGFAGVSGLTSWTVYKNAYYLRDVGYNSNVTASLFKTKSFSDVQSVKGSAYVSKPYDSALSGKAFPLIDPTGIGSHYGDWPTEIGVQWLNGKNEQVESYSTLTGAIPEFVNSTSHPAPDYTATSTDGRKYLAFWNGSGTRDDEVSMALGMTKNTVITATYASIAYPDFSTMANALASSWTVTNGSTSTSPVAYLGKSNNQKQIDSEAPWLVGNYANAATSMRSYLIYQGYYSSDYAQQIRSNPTDAAANHPEYIPYSFRVVKASGSKTDTKKEGRYLVFLGEKITDGMASCNVIKFDVGRSNNGKPAFQRGTIDIGTTTQVGKTYSLYLENTFTPTSAWFTL